jgi:hypothetical protein
LVKIYDFRSSDEYSRIHSTTIEKFPIQSLHKILLETFFPIESDKGREEIHFQESFFWMHENFLEEEMKDKKIKNRHGQDDSDFEINDWESSYKKINFFYFLLV